MMDEVNKLIEDLKHPDSDVRLEAAAALGDLGDHRATQPLISILLDKEWYVKGEAVVALTKIGQPAADALLAVLADEDSTDELRAAAIFALGNMGYDSAAHELSEHQGHLFRGAVLCTQGDYDLAIRAFSQAIQDTPHSIDAYILRAIAYEEMGEVDCAIKDYSQVLEIDAEYIKAYAYRAHAYYTKGKPQRVLQDCTSALRIDPQRADIYGMRGEAYRALGEDEQAIADFTQAIEINPRHAEAYVGRAQTYVLRWKASGSPDDYDLALEDFQECLRLAPGLAEGYYSRAFAYYLNKQYELARKDWEKVVELEPNGPLGQKSRDHLKKVASGDGRWACCCAGPVMLVAALIAILVMWLCR